MVSDLQSKAERKADDEADPAIAGEGARPRARRLHCLQYQRRLRPSDYGGY